MHPDFKEAMALDQAALDLQHSPSKFAKDANGSLVRMVQDTEAARTDPGIAAMLDIPYGPRPRAKLDLYKPASVVAAPLPCLVFIHGGFWQEGDKSVSGFAAQSLCADGWAWVSVGYTLTPEVTLTELTEEIHAALAHLAQHAQAWGIDPARIVLAGHSAGGQLAAAVLADVLGRGGAMDLAGAVLISGVYELAPVAQSYVNDLARMDSAEIARLSPLRHLPVVDCPVHILVGADEPELFLLQSRALAAVWQPHLSCLTEDVPAGRDHFDVLDALNDPRSPTRQAMAEMVGKADGERSGND